MKKTQIPFTIKVSKTLRLPLLILGAVVSLALCTQFISCKKTDSTLDNGYEIGRVSQKSPVASSRTDTYSPTPEMDMLAYKDKADSPHEATGQTIFEHFAYFQGEHSSLDYYPASMHAEIQGVLTDFSTFDIGNTVSDVVLNATAHIQNSNKPDSEKNTAISKVQALETYYQSLVAQVDAGKFNSFGNIWFYLKDQDSIIKNNPELSDEVKEFLMLYNSVMRNYLKYEFARGGFEPSAEERGNDNCFLGYKVKCWLKYGLVSLVKIGAYVTGIILSQGSTAPYMIPLIIAELAAVAIKMESAECRCNTGVVLDDLFPCKTPRYVNVSLNGCGLTQKLTTWDYGNNYSGDFVWELTGATAPDLGNEGNIVSRTGNVVRTNFPWLIVTQTDPAIDIYVQVSLLDCQLEGGNGFVGGFFNFHDLTVTEAGTIFISRANGEVGNHVVQIGTTHGYSAYGNALLKVSQGLNTLSFTTNVHGQIQSSSPSSGGVTVRWVQYTVPQSPYSYNGKVTVTAQGLCSSVTNSATISAAVQL